MIFSEDGRMANSPLFSKHAIASAQNLIDEHIKELSQVFEAKVGKDEPLELQTTFLAYTTHLPHDCYIRSEGSIPCAGLPGGSESR